MDSRVGFDRESAVNATSVRMLVATLCVLALVCLTLLHFGAGGGFGNEFAEAKATATLGVVADSPGSLRAPTSDPSLPSLEATFSRMNAEPADEPPAPTF